jgi:hypothetical protein
MYDFSVQDAAMIMFPSSAFLVLCTPIAGWAGDRIVDFPRGKTATTILNLCVTLGGALSVAMLAAILDQRYQVRQVLLAETQLLPSAGTQHALQALESLAMQLGGALSPAVHARVLLGRLINREALLLAFNDSFGFFIVISLCGLALTLFFRRARPKR